MSRTDSLICLAAALAVAAAYALLWQPARGAHTASVWVAGEERMRLPLDRDQRIDVEGPLGVSVVEVRDGRARVAQSPGPRQICVRLGWLQNSGESAICLPNQVVLRLEGDGGFDSMNF